MNIIFIGGLFPKHLLNEIKDMGSYVDYASYTFHTALVSGLDHWFADMRVVSSLRVDAYPKVKKIYFPPEDYSHKDGAIKSDRFVGLVNLPGIKMLSVFLRLRKNLKAMLKENDDNIVIAYSLNSRTAMAVATLHNRIRKCCYVIPDLPEFMSDKGGRCRAFAKGLDRQFINWAIKKIDVFALLSPYMVERLPIYDKPWVQMEGIYNPKEKDIVGTKEYLGYKSIFYSGDLDLRYGIKDILDAFELIKNDNYRLIICGAGNGKPLIEERAKKDKRIQFLGVIDHDKVISIQRGVSVLINPRHRSEEYTRYSFPSKTMEYLASGTPVVMHHLDSIPSEYDSYLNYIEEETPTSIKDKIIEICEDKIEESRNRAEAATFILNNKNAIVQTKKIYDLLLR